MERLVLVFTLMLAFQSAALAQLEVPREVLPQTIRLHLVSWHDRGGFENVNPGAALRWSSGLTIGGFRNSYGRPSWYAGLVVTAYESRTIQLELMAGVITGYSDSTPADVVAVPTLGWRVTPRSTLQVVFMPRFVIPANVVHVMFEQRLGGDPAPHAR